MGLVRMQVYCEVKAYTPYTAKNTDTISSTNMLLTRQKKKKDHARSCDTLLGVFVFMVFVLFMVLVKLVVLVVSRVV